MTYNWKLYLSIVAGGAMTTACSTTDRAVGLRPEAALSISAASISVHYLPQPAGVTVYDAGLSAGGMIFGRTSSDPGPVRPFVWNSPYAAPPVEIAPAGSIGNADDPNDNGDIRGNLNGPGFWAHEAAGWRFANVATGGYSRVSVTSINNSRTIVGYGTPDGNWRALWWSDELAQPTELPNPTLTGTVTNSMTHAMNNLGDVVGEVTEQRRSGGKVTVYKHAVLWRRGPLDWEATVLKGVGTYTVAYDVNDMGQVAGQATNDPVRTALLWTPSNGVYGDPVVVSTTHSASKVDRCGRVVGTTHTNTPNKRRAYVWENGVSTELPFPPNAIATQAQSIATDLITGQGIILGAAQPGGTKNVNASFLAVRWEIPGCP